MLISPIYRLPRVPENASLSDASLPPCIPFKLEGRGILVEAKALATLIFAVIRGSACGISGECDSFYSGSKNGHLLFLVQLHDGIILVHPHIPVLPTNGHTDSFSVGYHSDSFQHVLAY